MYWGTPSPFLFFNGTGNAWRYTNVTTSTFSNYYPAIVSSTYITTATGWVQVCQPTGVPYYESSDPYDAEIPRPDISRRDERLVSAQRDIRRQRVREVADERMTQARIVLERSMALYRALRGKQELDRFLAGETIFIVGVLFRYAITKSQDLLQHTLAPDQAHIPYKLELYEEERRLARGCVVIRDTPVMDQIIAVIAHLNNVDDEARLLRVTNWSPADPVRASLRRRGIDYQR
jgi:hypothetical protein